MNRIICMLVALLPVSAFAVDYPTLKDPAHAAMLERYKIDRSNIEAEGFFTPPSAAASSSCSMSEVDLYQLSGLEHVHPDLKGKAFDKNNRRFYRSVGAPGFKYSWANVRFIVAEMPCENGTPNGMVKVFTSFDMIMDQSTTTTAGTSTSTITIHNVAHTDRWVYRAVTNGVIEDEYAMYSKQSLVAETHWSDPATEKAMQAVSKNVGSDRPMVSIGADYRLGNGLTLKVGVFSLMKDRPDLTSMSGGKITKFKDELSSSLVSGVDDTRTVMQTYSDAMPQLVSHSKDGVLHGEYLIYMENVYKKMGLDWRTTAGMENAREVTIDGRALLENRMCYQQNELVKMSPCPSE